MNHIQHPSNNLVLGAPAGWDQAVLPCSALPVTRIDWDGLPSIKSYWRPTAEELAALNSGSPVVLWIVGESIPPVALTVGE